MSWNRYTLLLFGILCTLSVSAQDHTVVKGHAPDFVGKKIHLYGYLDFVSETLELLDSSRVGTDGEFELSFDAREIRYVELSSDYVAARLYVSPGVQYDVEFPAPGTDQPRTFGRKATTEVIFNNLALEDINSLIIDFNQNYEVFFQSNYETLSKLFSPRNYGSLIDTLARPKPIAKGIKDLFEKTGHFSLQMDSVYGPWDNPYFHLYRSSVIGDLMMNSPATPREIYEKYIEPYSFSSQHNEFTRLQERFYRYYFARYSQSYGEADLSLVLNKEGDYEGLKTLLTKDDFLADPERMDVVIALGIKEIWPSNAITHSETIKVLESIEAHGASEMTRSLASNLVESLTASKKGFILKDMTFEDEFKDRRRISDLVGSPLLIEFRAPWCTACVTEHSQLNSLLDQYKDVIQVLRVEVADGHQKDKEQSDTKGTIHTRIPTDSDWLSTYQVLSLPHYILLDSEGVVMRDNCPLPSEGLENILYRLQAESKGDQRPKVGIKNN